MMGFQDDDVGFQKDIYHFLVSGSCHAVAALECEINVV